MKILRTEISLQDSSCPWMEYDDQADDIRKTSAIFGYTEPPKYVELRVSDFLAARVVNSVETMKKEDFSSVSFYVSAKDHEGVAESETAFLTLLGADEIALPVPSHVFCKGFKPKLNMDGSCLKVSIEYPFNPAVKVQVLMVNGYTEACFYAYFNLSDFGVKFPKFRPRPIIVND